MAGEATEDISRSNLLKEINFLANSRGVNAWIRDRLQFLHRAVRKLEYEGWQPIETAPKGEEEISILICNGLYQHQQRVAYYDLDADPKYPWHVEDAAEGFNHHKDWPTHWMPLPAPPKMEVEKI